MDKSLKLEPADNSKERKTPQISTDSPPPSPISQILELSPNDDDSITTSTESSDTFEAWTLVMDKQKSQVANRIEIIKDNDQDDDHYVEDDEEVEETEQSNDKELHDSSNDVTTDDLSDGISIISESESNGRISPHPHLRDHLQDLNLKFATAQYDGNEILHKLRQEVELERPYPPPVIVTDRQQIRQRTGRRSFNEPQQNKDNALQQSPQTVVERNNMPPLLKRGLQGIFYIGVAVAILGLIGKIRNPTWQPLGDSNNPSAAELEQKVNDIELQNNLMRAEIDLLNKQVKYLNNLNEPQQHKKYKLQHEDPRSHREAVKGKTFKAWSGNGETLRPVEITKEDLRRPYNCPDGSFTEFAGMCVENQRNEPNIVEQFEQIVDDFKQQSETMQTFEKVAQELHGFTESPLEQVQQLLMENGNQQPQQQQQQDSASKMPQEQRQPNEYTKNKPIYQPTDYQLPQNGYKQHWDEEGQFQQIPASKERKDYAKCKDKSDTKCFNKEFKRPNDGEKKNHKHHHESHSNEKFDKFESDKIAKNEKNYKFDTRGNDNDKDVLQEYINKRRNRSKERYRKRVHDLEEHYKDDDSIERYQKRDDDSKERFNKRSKENSSKERVQKQKPHDSGEWQERYMKHRENVRKENEQKYYGDNKNWYIKRGDSRENKRNIDDIHFR